MLSRVYSILDTLKLKLVHTDTRAGGADYETDGGSDDVAVSRAVWPSELIEDLSALNVPISLMAS